MIMSKKQFFVYTAFPQLRPRLQALFFTGFNYIPYFIALVYQTVKLLPAGHAYLDPANIGRYGIRHVIAEAANNLEFSKRNIDQIILFGMVLVGLMIVFAQIVLLCMSLFTNFAFAGPNPMNSFPNFFVTPAPQQDIALMMLDLVFGVPNFFMSCVDTVANPMVVCQDSNGINITNTAGQWILTPLGWPMPIHDALHAMFRVYNIGLLVVAAFITCYFIAAVALETAQTGTPFGKRFNKLWAPLRIVVAFGLLIPLGSPGNGPTGVNGLNTAQYIVLYAAKFGSAFATNGWKVFNDTLTDTYVGQMQDLVSTPNTPEVGGILQFMFVASTCREYYANIRNPIDIQAYVVKDVVAFQPREVFSDIPADTMLTYDSIIDFIEGGSNIVIRFGAPDDKKETPTKGFVKPICGEIIIPLTDPRNPTLAPPVGSEPGAEVMQRYYTFLLHELWNDVLMGNPPAGHPALSPYTENYPLNMVRAYSSQKPDSNALLPSAEYRTALSTFYNTDVKAALTNPASTGLDDPSVLGSADGAIQQQIDSASWAIGPTLLSKGWAGAGIWYNKIAELNGAVTESTMSVPTVSKWPEVMEYVRLKKRQQDQHVSVHERFKPELGGKYDVPNDSPITTDAANVMWEAFNFWQEGDFATTSHTEPTGNIFIDAVNAIFGTEGLFNMRKNANIHPLAQLTGMGKSLIEASIRNLTFAGVGGGSAAFIATFDLFAGASTYAVSSFMVSIAMITMSAGFLLYYIVPFLPFIYFFFALGGWLKAIFEAMVGAPLWALAHIRIDGNGLPGAAAVNGYFLIFEIFLRPILIIFGLLASISIFSALVAVLNQIWDLITANLTGFDVVYDAANGDQQQGVFRSAIDTFFFTVIYAIIVYMMALSSFKLIDLIPANILRWMGQSVATENDARENAAESLASTSTVGANQAITAMGGALKGPLDKAAAETAAKQRTAQP